MLNAVIHLHGSTIRFVSTTPGTAEHPATSEDNSSTAEGHGDAHTCVGAECPKDPGPIVPELKELAWGGGSFIVLAVLMRWVIFPKLKASMEARYQGIQNDLASADQARAAARAEVADYEAQVASIKAEAAKVVDAARNEVEAERQAQIGRVNARIGERRTAAQAEADAAREAAKGHIAAAVGDVAARAGELATGRRPAADTVNRVVNEVMAR